MIATNPKMISGVTLQVTYDSEGQFIFSSGNEVLENEVMRIFKILIRITVIDLAEASCLFSVVGLLQCSRGQCYQTRAML